MTLPTITSFLPDSKGEIDQSVNLAAVEAIRYALSKTMNQYNNGELFIEGSIGNQHGICGVFQHHIDHYLSTKYENSLEESLIDNRLYRTFYMMIKSWPKCHTENMDDGTVYNINFPIDGSTEYFYERDNNTLWLNPNRIELLNYLIEVANNE